jgi:hypothetical protein
LHVRVVQLSPPPHHTHELLPPVCSALSPFCCPFLLFAASFCWLKLCKFNELAVQVPPPPPSHPLTHTPAPPPTHRLCVVYDSTDPLRCHFLTVELSNALARTAAPPSPHPTPAPAPQSTMHWPSVAHLCWFIMLMFYQRTDSSRLPHLRTSTPPTHTKLKHACHPPPLHATSTPHAEAAGWFAG